MIEIWSWVSWVQSEAKKIKRMLKHVESFAMSAMVVICSHSLGIEQLRGHGNWTAQVSLAPWKQHEAMQAVAPSVTPYRLICPSVAC